jgi:hypothetical protein
VHLSCVAYSYTHASTHLSFVVSSKICSTLVLAHPTTVTSRHSLSLSLTHKDLHSYTNTHRHRHTQTHTQTHTCCAYRRHSLTHTHTHTYIYTQKAHLVLHMLYRAWPMPCRCLEDARTPPMPCRCTHTSPCSPCAPSPPPHTHTHQQVCT